MRKFVFTLFLCIIAVFLAATVSTAAQAECTCAANCACECDCDNACCEKGIVCPICEAIVKRRELPCPQASVLSAAQFVCVSSFCCAGNLPVERPELMSLVEYSTRMNN